MDHYKQTKYRLETRIFDGRLNETKQQALADFEKKFGFKPTIYKNAGLNGSTFNSAIQPHTITSSLG